MTRLLARIQTEMGPRTISVPRLAPEDAALLGQVIAERGDEYVIRDDGPMQSMAEICAQLKKAQRRERAAAAKRTKSNVAYLRPKALEKVK